MRMRLVLKGAAVAALALAQPNIAAAAGAYIQVGGSNSTISITGHDFPTNGSKVYLNAYGGKDQVWIGEQVVTPNQTKLASPPCATVCDKGEFFTQIQEAADPCAASHEKGAYLKVLVKWGTTRKPDRQTWGTLSCPIANAPTKPKPKS